jgi:hypothetical protein
MIDSGVEGRIISKRALLEYPVRGWTGFIRLKGISISAQ